MFKIFIQTDKFQGGGPNSFRSRLISALNGMEDIKVVTEIGQKFDLELALIRKVYKHDKPYILRLGSCYYDKKKIWNNKPIAKAVKRASYVIFQSKFAYKLCNQTLRIETRNLIKGNRYSIIYNGVDVDYIKSIEPNKKIIPGSFIACGPWNPNKRPISTIKGFLESDIKRHLYIVGGEGLGGGPISKKYNSKYVHILGKLSNKEMISTMKACDYQIHLCHIDICSNAVIEGLTCGLNVLCTNLGGTKELVGKNGVILEIDKFWNTKYIKQRILDKVDKVPPSTISKGIHRLMKKNRRSINNDFDINKIATKYYKIIKQVIKKK